MIYAYDYAYPSYDSTGLGSEIINSFIPNEATKPSWAPWTAENSLFCKCPLRNHSKLIKVTWIGINDLIYGDGDTDRPLDLIFHYQEMLYEYGARRFLLFDIPTIERSPGGANRISHKLANQKAGKSLVPSSRNGMANSEYMLISLWRLILMSMQKYFPHTTIFQG